MRCNRAFGMASRPALLLSRYSINSLEISKNSHLISDDSEFFPRHWGPKSYDPLV